MKKKFVVVISLILILISLLPLILKHKTTATFPQNTYCNVNFQHPIYEFKDSSGNSIFVLDENGNLYLNGTKVLLNQTGIAQPKTGFGLQVNSQFYWAFNNTNVNIHGEILQKQTIPNKPGDNDIIFRNPITKEPLAIFDGTTGDLKIKGLVIYNGYYDGLSFDKNAFNSNCTTIDNYNSSTGHDYYQDYYCNRINCVYRNIDLDLSQNLCVGNHHNWNLGGNVNPTTCCGDDANEFNLTRKCNSGCTSDNSDDACCDNSSDAVNGSTCYPEGSKICSPDNHNYVMESNSGKWNIFYNCTKQCFDSCNVFTTCNDGSCDSSSPVTLGSNCTPNLGEVHAGICNSTYACSNATGDLTYDNGGKWNCTATCDDSGGCTHATNCIDCSQPGNVNGCACACDGYGIQESTANGNCNDNIDNDCDGKADNQDSDCCLDNDGDGWGTQETYQNCPHNSTWDCNDSNASIHPEATEVCDNIDHDCDGYVNKQNGVTLTSTACTYHLGSCSGNYKSCTSSGTWGDCIYSPAGLGRFTIRGSWDRDCNGQVAKYYWTCATADSCGTYYWDDDGRQCHQTISWANCGVDNSRYGCEYEYGSSCSRVYDSNNYCECQ